MYPVRNRHKVYTHNSTKVFDDDDNKNNYNKKRVLITV